MKNTNIYSNRIMHFFRYNRCRAFTLAEVLIALGIVGVVAAITIGAVIQSSHNSANENRFRKIYSSIEQATDALANDVGGNLGDAFGSSITSQSMAQAYCTKLNCTSDCGVSATSKCWTIANVKNLNGTPYNLDYSTLGFSSLILTGDTVILADGTFLSIRQTSGSDLEMYIDVDGLKGQYMFGRDVFRIRVVGGVVQACGSTNYYGVDLKYDCSVKNAANPYYNGLTCPEVILEGKHVDDV